MLDSECLFSEPSSVVGVSALDLPSDVSGHDNTFAGPLLFKFRSSECSMPLEFPYQHQSQKKPFCCLLLSNGLHPVQIFCVYCWAREDLGRPALSCFASPVKGVDDFRGRCHARED